MPAASCSMTAASMSMIDHIGALLRAKLTRLRGPSRDPARGDGAIVPKDSIAGNALAAVVAIMTFLAAVTSGAVAMVISSATEWQSEIAREMTIQVRPIAGRDIEADVGKAEAIARAMPWVADVRPYSRQESERLLEPWLGSGLSLDELPVPRMIAVRVAPKVRPDTEALRQALDREVAGASLDDHRGWIASMRRMASAAIVGGLAIFGLVLSATILSVAFATRGAMASNRPIVEVLHFVGAKDAFIARQFLTHFLVLGLKGGVIGGGGAMLSLALAGPVSNLFVGTAGETQAAALFGAFSMGPAGYAMMAAEVVLIAVITALTSRQVVMHTLRRIE
jgi:cell division transport system permease protein